MKGKRILRRIVLPILGLVFILSTAKLVQSSVRSHQEQRAFENLALSVNAENDFSTLATAATPSGQNNAQNGVPSSHPTMQSANASPSPTHHERLAAPQSSPSDAYVSPYLSLKAQNADFYGWLSIAGTVLNYPVMYTPDDPEYYLYRAFDQTDSQSGVPFLDAACFDACGNYLIHGHNMKNGTMFATLLSYAQKEFWQQHPIIEFDTLSESGTYEVIAAFYSRISLQEEDSFAYYQYTDLSDPEDFNAYINQVEQAALYETGVTAQYGDQLLTLSTCSYHVQDGRFVVVAKK